MPDELAAQFQPDYTPEQMENLGVYDALYRGQGPRLASLGAWKPEWISEHDPKGWAQWYKRYVAGRRIPDEDSRQIKRWLSFKARHGGPFAKNPTPRRGWALRNWGIDPAKLVTKDLRNGAVDEMLDEYKRKAMQKYVAEKVASSALRRLMKITQQKVPWGATSVDATKWQARVGNRDIGYLITAPAAAAQQAIGAAPQQILYSQLHPQFRGLGLGRKLYMDVARRAGGELLSDTKVSPSAQRLWQGMQGRGYGVTVSPAAVPARHAWVDKTRKVYELPTAPIRDLPGSVTNMWDNVRSFFKRIMQPDTNALNYIYKMKLPAYIPRIKSSELLPDVKLQEHQQRIADRVTGEDPRMLVYHGLGSGKSLSALAAAEAAQKVYGGNYGIVAPASLRDNFKKEIKKFTRNSNPEVMSYTGLGMGKQFKDQPQTLIMDEAARLRNPNSAMTQAAMRAAQKADRLLLLTGTPITNEPKDLASLLSLIEKKPISPEEFDKQYVGEEKVWPGIWGWLRGAKSGVRPVIRNGPKLRKLLEGHVDYQPSKTPEGVNVNEEVVRVPLSPEQQKIQKAIRTKIPPGFLWKLDQEFPLSRDELAKLNSFLTGLRQVGLSTQPFRADKDPLKAFQQSAKMQEAFKNLRKVLDSDPRKKAIIYSNFVDSGLGPYAAGLAKANIPHAVFHGGVSPTARQAAVDAYNNNKLRALLIGPAGAEGLSTKGTSLIQLMDPHWNEARSRQAQGRGLRFDSHRDLPEELKNVAVQRYIASSEDPSWAGKLLGYKRERTGDEVLEHLTAEKERLNEEFRKILREVGSQKHPPTTG